MRKKNNLLLSMIILTAVLMAGIGGFLKFGVLAPLDLYQDESIIALPFMLASDEAMRAEIRIARKPVLETEPPFEPPTQPSEIPKETVTEPQTETSTEPSAEPPPTEPIIIDEHWFDDALLIGDSRLQSMEAYARLGDAYYFCGTSMSVFDVRTRKLSGDQFRSMKLEELLSQKEFGKVYIMLGINSIHMPHDRIMEEYQNLIDLIREKQPDAAIILHGIMTVSRGKAASRYYYSVDNIYTINEKIAALADGDNMFYIDANDWIADEERYLPSGMSKDGCHLYAKYYKEWSQWLMESAADFGIR